MMNTTLKLGLLLLLASSASAAVYHAMTDNEAQMSFALEADMSSVDPMQHLIDGGGFWTNSLGLGTIPSDVPLETNIRHDNTGEDTYWARIYFTIECDEGIQMASHTHLGDVIYDGIEDFGQITYKHPGHTIVECNNMSYIEVVSPNKVKITPMQEDTQFAGGYSRCSLLTLSFHPMAYGNYTLTVDTE